MVFNFNKHHNVVGMDFANNVAGKIHEQKAKVKVFLEIRAEADSIAKVNAILLNKQPANLLALDTSIKEDADYIQIDTLGNFKKIVQYIYRPAQVIYNTTNHDKRNYMILARGTDAGLAPEMGVIGAVSRAVVGKIVWANANYSSVMTLAHQKSIIPAKIAKNNENGIISWDGKKDRNVVMKRVQSSVDVKVGDSILTSKDSDIFPENLLIGTVQSIGLDKSTSQHIISIKTAANFNHINYVQVVENKFQKETRQVVKAADKQLGEIQ